MWFLNTKSKSPAIQLLCKPDAAKCYVDCEYCFSLSRELCYRGNRFRMADELLQAYMRRLLETHSSQDVSVIWQGGEPASLGLDFFQRAVDYMEESRKPGQRIRHAMRTNGALLNDKWCAFFKRRRFLIGLCVDGPPAIHNAYRVNMDAAGSFDEAVRGWDLLRSHRVEFSILCTINAANVGHPIELYRFFRDQLKDEPIHFLSSLERTSVGAERLSSFLIAIFDEWVRRDVGSVFVRNFDDALGRCLGQQSSRLSSPTCGNAIAVNHNTYLCSCEAPVEPASRLEGIPEPPVAELVDWGRPHRFAQDDLSAGYKKFYEHIHPAMKIMAGLLRQGRSASEVMRAYATQGARSAEGRTNLAWDNPCPCRSGKKFKHCHGNTESGSAIATLPLSTGEGNLPRWLARCIEMVSHRIQYPAWRS